MLAIVQLLLMIAVGDTIGRQIVVFHSLAHRLAVAFLSGLLFSTCATYLLALMAANTAYPMWWANSFFFGINLGLIVFLRNADSGNPVDAIVNKLMGGRPAPPLADADAVSVDESIAERPPGNPLWDWLCLGGCMIMGCWLMFSTLNYVDGNFEFAIKSWSDFGANVSVAQSLAQGHNFPTEHPFVPGEAIRYHFLFWFQAANLSFLGLNVVWAINLLSLLSLAALLILIMTLAESLFDSRPVARIATVLFFFASTSLSYIPFLLSQASLSTAVNTVLRSTDFLKSGYPYRGDDWGGLSVAVFANQRHLISAAGILLVVFIYLIDFYRRKNAIGRLSDAGQKHSVSSKPLQPSRSDFRSEAVGLIYCGILIGAMPYWNSAVFIAASIILGGLFIFFSFRRYLALTIGTVILVGLPQLLLLRSGNLAQAGASFFNWGFTIQNPTVRLILEYLGWTFGLKWILLLIALLYVPNAHRRLLIVITSLVPVVFLFQLSTDSFNNHKLLNIWNVLASVYVAYALWLIGRGGMVRAILATFIAVVMTFGAVIDLFPIHNDAFVRVPYENDRLTTWLYANTQPSDLFLSDTFLSHPILFTGRKIFLGNTLFAWTAGYQLNERESRYRSMFQERDPENLVRLLNDNKIAYVAIDDGLRTNGFVKDLNETVFQENFEKVFDDTGHQYGNLTLYKVPASFSY